MYRLKNSSLYFRLKWLFLFLILGSACGEADTAQTIIANTGETEEKIPLADTGKVSAKTDETFSIEYLMGKFDPERHPDFVKVDKKYADDDQKLLRKDAYEAFLKMREAALKDGIELKILSATRNFNRQKTIWEAKWNGSRLVENQDLSKTIPNPEKRALKILEYSSMPGTSRHHWGTDIDLNSLEPAYF
ncbi:MAG TPA: M15 family metallopeptidase, partial [Saprospiraceae bacterium]|nr:M15 family metallopeptidase [Saprospiraceae bacterium]